MKQIYTFILLIAGISFSTVLLNRDIVTEPFFPWLLIITLIIAVVAPNSERITDIKWKDFGVKLSEIRNESKELKRFGVELTELIAVNSAFQNRYSDEETNALLKEINEAQLERVIEMVDATSERDRVLKYKKLFDEFDAIGGEKKSDPKFDEKKARKEKIYKEINDLLKSHRDSLKNNRNNT